MHISSKIGNIILRGAGIATLGMVAYDSHVLGKIKSKETQRKVNANATTNAFMNTLSLSRPSAINRDLKKGVLNFEMESNFRGFFAAGWGYLKGIANSLISSAVPLALGVGATFAKGVAAKASGIGLALYAGYTFAREILGIGKSKYI